MGLRFVRLARGRTFCAAARLSACCSSRSTLKSSALIGSELSHGGSSALLEPMRSGKTAIHAPGEGLGTTIACPGNSTGAAFEARINAQKRQRLQGTTTILCTAVVHATVARMRIQPAPELR